MPPDPRQAAGAAWDLNRIVAINVHGHAEEAIDYRTVLAAVALAEAGLEPDPAIRALEENALPDGMHLGVAAFGSITPSHNVILDAESLELAVRLARRFLALDGGRDG